MLVGDEETSGKKVLPAWAQKYWTRLTPKQQKLTILSIFTVGILLFAGITYKSRKHSIPPSAEAKKMQEITLDSDLIEKSMYTKAQQTMDEQQKALANMQKEIARLKAEAKKSPPVNHEKEKIPPPPAKKTGQAPAPPPTRALPMPPPPTSFGNDPDENNSRIFGGIEQVVYTPALSPDEDDDSKKKFQIFLPPSFMAATLLSGVDATTTTAGKNNPVPILLRIKDLAILPNLVKADLKGCFVLGEGKGDLATERVDVRLLTLSCVSRNGESVIDQPVKGYVVDGDGKAGLRGTVAAKMGALLARSAFAGFLGGLGQAVQTSTQTTQTTAVGTTQQVWNSTDTDNLIKGGVGGGISEAATQLERFYLQLAQQTLPIIQVGATKTVTVVISDGVNLEVKNESLIQ